MGWRNQVPYLLSLGLQVVVPDMLGYGQTSAPESFKEYTMKKISSHIATVIKEVTDQPIILGGHDWGGWFVVSDLFFFVSIISRKPLANYSGGLWLLMKHLLYPSITL